MWGLQLPISENSFVSSLMEHIVLKEKLILRNMLNQVYNLPEMKLSSAYFRKMHHMWLGSCTRHSTSIALFAFKNHDDLRKASKYCHIGKKKLHWTPCVITCFFSNEGICSNTSDHSRQGQKEIVSIVLLVFACVGEQICHPKMYFVGVWIILFF